ncbi:hypothetical protein AAFF_G00160250 [Aldrovandia affinis]|uniref:Uncharacterized protein n=1 Tax=Aldrovandia affinis TaxID=143900 RepID=A0AAD7RN24_9TELE|nr:hypothetical protein AAFF_G00160250 [Aldrovandia affinis]
MTVRVRVEGESLGRARADLRRFPSWRGRAHGDTKALAPDRTARGHIRRLGTSGGGGSRCRGSDPFACGDTTPIHAPLQPDSGVLNTTPLLCHLHLDFEQNGHSKHKVPVSPSWWLEGGTVSNLISSGGFFVWVSLNILDIDILVGVIFDSMLTFRVTRPLPFPPDAPMLFTQGTLWV